MPWLISDNHLYHLILIVCAWFWEVVRVDADEENCRNKWKRWWEGEIEEAVNISLQMPVELVEKIPVSTDSNLTCSNCLLQLLKF